VGGVAVHVTELAAALERSGHEVHVFTRMAQGQGRYERIDGVHYHRCPYPAHHDFVDDVNNMCRAFVERVFVVEDMIGRFDIVHAHDWLAANAMIWIKQGRGRKTVLTIHSTEYARCGNAFPGGRSIRIRDQERAGTYWADKVICVSHATKREIMWMYEVPESKTAVVYNGVNSDRFNVDLDVADVRRRYDIGPMDPTVLFCGRLEWQKGPDILMEAIPSILRHYSNAKFLFVGDGGMRGDLERRASQLGAGHAVRFLGFRNGDDIVGLFKLSDGICVPSRNEPFGIVILEAWSAGKPVVATDNGGPSEYVCHEFNGLKVAPNPDSIAWGLGTLLSDFERARWMGENGRRVVRVRFTWDLIGTQTLDAYGFVALESAVTRGVRDFENADSRETREFDNAKRSVAEWRAKRIAQSAAAWRTGRRECLAEHALSGGEDHR
jgi:glycosyltransferase involved in cell wall biosynthesis